MCISPKLAASEIKALISEICFLISIHIHASICHDFISNGKWKAPAFNLL